MTLPVQRGTPGRIAGRQLPGWARNPLAQVNDLFGRVGNLLGSTVGEALAPVTEAWSPKADVSETDDAYLIEGDVPGLRREDIDVEISGRELVIRGEPKERESADTPHRRTRRFEYRTVLPGEVNAEGAGATLRDGVLTVTVPKAEAIKPHHIEVTTGD
jgi:HSP20 family protein